MVAVDRLPRVVTIHSLPPNLTFRRAERCDEPVLRDMLYLALFVPPGSPPADYSVVAQPELARYVSGWGRRGDDGIIAVASNGEPIGAAWLRLWSEHDHGYGFIDALTPELSMAVRPEARGGGIGTQLLRRLLQRADESHDSVSLSVSAQNPAVRLYERLGFRSVAVVGASMTMTRTRPTDARRCGIQS
jgi:GNAT superfamily N-acetyltransferase